MLPILLLLLPAVLSSSVLFTGQRGLRKQIFDKITIDPAVLAGNTFGHGWVTQPQDHFDSANKNTWKQRFFYNTAFQTADSVVAILYISGEEPASGTMVFGAAIEDYARKLNAPIYALEHRFYGESLPTKDACLDSLQYLSSRQVIEDIADFIRQQNEVVEKKWIVVGGSYTGDLAAWSRLTHPELIVGALVSSAPLKALVDNYGYFQVVDADFKKVGGLCYDQITKGFDEIQGLFQSTDGRDKLSKTFRINPPLADYDDITDEIKSLFFAAVTQAFEISAQFGSPTQQELCNVLTAGGAAADPMEALASLLPADLQLNVNFTAIVEGLQATGFNDELVNDRLWAYQTCTEFGWYLSTNQGKSAFGQTRSSNPGLDLCFELFGITTDDVAKNVEATNNYYGGADYFAGTNVVLTIGTNDPWSFLGKSGNPNHWSVVVINIEGAAHCADLEDGCFNGFCDDNMKHVQQLVLENMQRWIDPVFPVSDRVDITDTVGQRPLSSDQNVAPPPAKAVNAQTKMRAKRSPPAPHFNRTSKWRSSKKRRVQSVGAKPDVSEGVGEGYIVQTFDHFNPNEDRTFKQKFYFNYEHGTPDGPNFLMIGGEGPEDIAYIQTESWLDYAEEVGANMFLLEHRYYGDSKLGTNDLQYLSSAQMLYDVATFIRTQQVKQNRTGPWVAFGGSNPGALAAWSREWFPELIVGAVASSAPLHAKNDFYEYLEVVGDVLGRSSQLCADRTADAFDRLRRLAQDPDGRETIHQKFKLWPGWPADGPADLLDIEEVYSNLFAVHSEEVQFNKVDGSSVKKLCSIMEDKKYVDSLDALRAVQTAYYNDDNVATLSSFDADLQSLKDMLNYVDGHDPAAFDNNQLADLLWSYQTCAEFGYYQTTNYGRGVFGTPVPLNFYIAMCEGVFGLGMVDVERAVAMTNYHFGGNTRYNSTNVVFSNGDADPWHRLGLLERGDRDDSIVTIVIKGTSHCADMNAATPDDPQQLIDARKQIVENIKKWIAPAPPSTTTSQPIPTSTIPTTSVTSPTTSVKGTSPTVPTISPTTSGTSTVATAFSIAALLMSMLF